MPAVKIVRETAIARTPRLMQVEGMFDMPQDPKTRHEWTVDFEVGEDWHVGVVVGPSGSGKSTIARELFPGKMVEAWEWPAHKALVDGFPASMGTREVCQLLSSVGFSSPPGWRKPYHVLSNGEKFRVDVARTLAEMPELAVVDEFTSVVDRTVAKVGSAAVAKAVRRRKAKLVAVSCHYDVLEWLEPDWVYDVQAGSLAFNDREGADAPRGSVRRWRRPPIELQVYRTTAAAWGLFKHHHYLDHSLHKAAACFVAEVEGRPAAFVAMMPKPGQVSGWRVSRVVCLPDFQGVSAGNAALGFVCSLYAATGKPVWITTSHPAFIAGLSRSREWRMNRKPSMVGAKQGGRLQYMKATSAASRLTAGFRYVGPARPREAAAFRLNWVRTK